MELTASPPGEDRPASEPLLSDFWKALAAILIGILVGLLIGYVSNRWDAYFALWTLVVGPVTLLIALLNYRRRRRGLTVSRTLGAVAGWLSFVAAFYVPEFNQFLLVLREPVLVLAVTVTTAAALIAGGLFVSEYVRTTLGVD